MTPKAWIARPSRAVSGAGVSGRMLAAGLATLATVLPMALVTGLAGCGDPSKSKPGPGGGKPRAFAVHVRPVAEQTIPNDIHASGTARPSREVQLTTQVQGSITFLKVALGQRVEQGELLARVSTVGLFGDSQQASAEIKRLKTDLEQARQEKKDTERLFEQKIASRQQLDDARYKLLRLEAQDAQARARLAQVGEHYRGGAVHAPFGGIIAEQGVELGDYVTPGKVIGRLVDLSSVKVTVGLAEVDLPRVTAKTPVTVAFPALGDRALPGRILALSPTADKLSGSFPVEIEVPNPAGDLRGGMAARAQFLLPGIRGMFVPTEAVVQRSGQDVAYVLHASRTRVEQRPCKVGLTRDGLVQVLEGLRPGDLLVISGNTRLRNGSRVEVASDQQPKGPPEALAPASASTPRPRNTASQ